jgi:hypothetical protein
MPARDRGRLQRMARELLRLGTVTTRDMAQAAFPSQARFSKRDYERCRLALRHYADPIRRLRGGGPWIWRRRDGRDAERASTTSSASATVATAAR